MYLDGELAKTMDRDRFVNRDGFNDFTHQQIINHRANRITEVEISDWDLTTALDDRMFSTRTLMLGE
jgi:hypothetical protein